MMKNKCILMLNNEAKIANTGKCDKFENTYYLLVALSGTLYIISIVCCETSTLNATMRNKVG